MTAPQKTIHNALTGETIIRDFNVDELAQLEADKAQAAIDVAETEAFIANKQAARQAVLKKLGLTADEIAALLG